MAGAFRSDVLERLVQRLLAGEVAFFIGSGFSLDSEPHNGTSRLLSRLFARLLAMSWVLSEDAADEHARECARRRLDGLVEMFDLSASETRPFRIATHANLEKLAREYYVFNDWTCSTFSELLPLVDRSARRRSAMIRQISALEGALLGNLDPEATPLPEIELPPETLPSPVAGKILFLETLGFRDPRCWRGDPTADESTGFLGSYRGLLRPRHRALACWAREGLTPVVLTTNYDLLLEGAYRAAGFELVLSNDDGNDRHPTQDARSDRERTLCDSGSRYQRAVVVAGDLQFFESGDAHLLARIVKIHGCVTRYREAWPSPESPGVHGSGAQPADRWKPLQTYLPSVVYTYREIQNWREDSWSRDYLRTLIRTNTLVFAGYSGMDPVIHDTLRTVYEEMARRRKGASGVELGHPRQAGRAYYFVLDGKDEFHSREILRAAAAAEGVETELETTNQLTFKRRGHGFPTMDDVFGWLRHRTTRELQCDALNLSRVALARMMSDQKRGPRPPEEFARLQASFRALIDEELAKAEGWEDRTDDEASRRCCAAITNWTAYFHEGLMRVMADRERAVATFLPDFGQATPLTWYVAVSHRQEWTAWGVVLELALRRVLAQELRQAGRGSNTSNLGAFGVGSDALSAAPTIHPTVVFPWPPTSLTTMLTIRFAPLERMGSEARRAPLPCDRSVIWNLPIDSAPWPDEPSPESAEISVPPAQAIWECAVASDEELDSKRAPLLRSLGCS